MSKEFNISYTPVFTVNGYNLKSETMDTPRKAEDCVNSVTKVTGITYQHTERNWFAPGRPGQMTKKQSFLTREELAQEAKARED